MENAGGGEGSNFEDSLPEVSAEEEIDPSSVTSERPAGSFFPPESESSPTDPNQTMSGDDAHDQILEK